MTHTYKNRFLFSSQGAYIYYPIMREGITRQISSPAAYSALHSTFGRVIIREYPPLPSEPVPKLSKTSNSNSTLEPARKKLPPPTEIPSTKEKRKQEEKKANPTPSPELAIEHLFPPDPADKATVERKKIPKIKKESKTKQNKPHSKHHADRKTPVFFPHANLLRMQP